MDCPSCGSENPEDKRFCGDCGALISGPLTVQPQHATIHSQRWRNSVLIACAALVVSAIVILAVVVAYAIDRSPSPEEVLVSWIDCLNNADVRGAADLTIYSKMDLTDYLTEVNRLEEGVRGLGTDKITLNFVQEIPKEQESGEDWFSGLTYMINWLGASFGVIVEDHVGVYFSLTSYADGVQVAWIDSFPVFEVDSSWYLAYGLWYP